MSSLHVTNYYTINYYNFYYVRRWSDKWWKSFGGCLISADYLQERSSPGTFGSVVQLTSIKMYIM